MPEPVSFALPTLASSDMTKDDQGALIVNQATAVIVAAWLEHCTAMRVQANLSAFDITLPGLVNAINDVQNALHTF